MSIVKKWAAEFKRLSKMTTTPETTHEWVLYLQMRKRFSLQCLDRFNKDSTNFVRWFVIMDKPWVQQYTPKPKQQSTQWVRAGFWDAKDILLITLEKVEQLQANITSN